MARGCAEWGGNDNARWKKLHSALLSTYEPAWDRTDARDILVAWAAANLAFSQAGQALVRLEGLKGTLTSHQKSAREAAKADVAFWGRLVAHLDDQVPIALKQDSSAAKTLADLICEEEGA